MKPLQSYLGLKAVKTVLNLWTALKFQKLMLVIFNKHICKILKGFIPFLPETIPFSEADQVASGMDSIHLKTV